MTLSMVERLDTPGAVDDADVAAIAARFAVDGPRLPLAAPVLAIADIEDKRARQRAAETGKPANARTAPPRLVEGAGVNGWKQALNSLEMFFPGRIPVDAR
jgi:putative transposase